MFDEYDTFRLTKLIPGQPLPVGSIGVVLMVFTGTTPDYEVEFTDANGKNIGNSLTHTISEDYMEMCKVTGKGGTPST